MRRWNGWGDPQVDYPLPQSARVYLEQRAGPGVVLADASFEQALAGVTASRLGPPASHTGLSDSDFTLDPAERLRHARGQSLPDWIALRSGNLATIPDGVAFPADQADLRRLLDFARRSGTKLIPYGGGTSVTGQVNPQAGFEPVLTIDLGRFNKLLDFDETSRLATFGAGASGPQVESSLNHLGYTLGHFPQSFELSTLGGWIATRSTGQQSYHYGRIEDLFAGGQVETLQGPLDLRPLPASAAGPDLRQWVLGSEGRLGIITQAMVRVQRLPEFEAFYGVFIHDWEAGAAALREIVQAGIAISMARLSDAQETQTTLALAGQERLMRWAGPGLRLLGYSEGRCLLIFGVTGGASQAKCARWQVQAILRAHGGLFTGQAAGRAWSKSRFLIPYLRNTLWQAGYALDTLETALPWSALVPTALAIKAVIQQRLDQPCDPAARPGGLVFAHISHLYPDGGSIYVTYLYPRSADPQMTLARWQEMKAAASQIILERGGTISHQHGVGSDHAAFLPKEKGPLGMALIRSAAAVLDPQGILNPGKLWR